MSGPLFTTYLLLFSSTVEESSQEAVINAFQTALSQSKQCAYCVLGVVFLGCFVTLQPSAGYVCIKELVLRSSGRTWGRRTCFSKGDVEEKASSVFLYVWCYNNYSKPTTSAGTCRGVPNQFWIL